MKHFIFPCALCAGLAVLGLSGCSQSETSGLTPVTLNEVAHSVFYAPQYAAIELGCFEEEGIEPASTSTRKAPRTTPSTLPS